MGNTTTTVPSPLSPYCASSATTTAPSPLIARHRIACCGAFSTCRMCSGKLHDIVASVGKKRKYKKKWEERISNGKEGSNNNNSKQCNSTLVRRNSAYLKMHLPPILTCVGPTLVKSILLKDCKNKNKKHKLRKCQILMQKLNAWTKNHLPNKKPNDELGKVNFTKGSTSCVILAINASCLIPCVAASSNIPQPHLTPQPQSVMSPACLSPLHLEHGIMSSVKK